MCRTLTRPALPDQQHCATPTTTIPLSCPDLVAGIALPALMLLSYAHRVLWLPDGVHVPDHGLCPSCAFQIGIRGRRSRDGRCDPDSRQ
jgi:hypothetical protein